MSQRTAEIVNFESYANKTTRSETTTRDSKRLWGTSNARQGRLPWHSQLPEKAHRLSRINPQLADVIERLVDDMLEELKA